MARAETLNRAFGRSVLEIEALVNPDFTGAMRRDALAGANRKALEAEKAAELADFNAAAKVRAEAAKAGVGKKA